MSVAVLWWCQSEWVWSPCHLLLGFHHFGWPWDTRAETHSHMDLRHKETAPGISSIMLPGNQMPDRIQRWGNDKAFLLENIVTYLEPDFQMSYVLCQVWGWFSVLNLCQGILLLSPFRPRELEKQVHALLLTFNDFSCVWPSSEELVIMHIKHL